MSFLFPAFLVGALAVVIPIAIHLWKRQNTTHIFFSDIRFLRRAKAARRNNLRVREWLLLALRVFALILLAAAFARPFMDEGGLGAKAATVVVLDRSFSMAAPGVFARARAAAAGCRPARGTANLCRPRPSGPPGPEAVLQRRA